MNSQYNLPAQFSGRADIQKVIDSLDPDDWCGDESMIHALQRAIAAIEQDRAALVPDEWRNAVQEFVDRCDAGEVRSRKTYAKFKALLAAAPQPRSIQPVHPDDMAVDRFAAFMKAKLADARNKGRSGWEECSQTELSRMLREHVEKGDPRDVANFAMFLWSLGYGIVAQPVQEQSPYAWIRWNGGQFRSGIAHLGAICPPGWVGATAVFLKPATQQKDN